MENFKILPSVRTFMWFLQNTPAIIANTPTQKRTIMATIPIKYNTGYYKQCLLNTTKTQFKISKPKAKEFKISTL